MFEGTERFFRPGYVANLTASDPALTGVEDRLRAAPVATSAAASRSTVNHGTGYPPARSSVDYTRSRSSWPRPGRRTGVSDRVEFQVAGAADLDGSYDFIALFDCLHDMPDPIAALRRPGPRGDHAGDARRTMSWTPSRRRSTRSAGCCPARRCYLPAHGSQPSRRSASQPGRPGADPRAGPRGRFLRSRVAASTDFNLVYELGPEVSRGGRGADVTVVGVRVAALRASVVRDRRLERRRACSGVNSGSLEPRTGRLAE